MNSLDELLINKYVIIRANAAGVFAGILKKKEGDAVELENARRLWFWKGAATLSQLACEGVKYPEECKFPQEVPQIVILGVIEIIAASDIAKESIAKVEVWKA